MSWGDVKDHGYDENYTSMQHMLLDRLDDRIAASEAKNWSVEKTSIALIAVSFARLTAELSGTLCEGGDAGIVSSLVRIADVVCKEEEE